MKNKAKQKNEVSAQVISPSSLQSVMSNDFARYAKAVLTERAVPDVRDGMKPVQRRIIYGMYKEGNTFDKPTRKCATTVGYIMGHFHPHGDSSIYDALVRLSQNWKMEVPLVDFQGNNGCYCDKDSPAASRYTEARLAKIAELMVQDIDKNTVDMTLNFSDEELEPVVLPSRFPNLLVNGANGIAVGAVTNIPTHNFNEVIEATIYAIKNKSCTVQDLMKYIKGPDFPTGGKISQLDELKKLYETGQASFSIHCQTHLEKNLIVIDDLPYGTIKSDFVKNLDTARINQKIDNVLEIRDESSSDIRIVIEVKPGSDVQAILSFYKKKGLLKETFAANMLAIDKGHPKTMNLLEIIRAYIDHQVEVIYRRSKFLLDKANKRINILNGLIKAVDIIDPLIDLIKKSKGKQDAKNKIIEAFGFNEEQAEAIVMLNLYRINSLDYQTYVNEKKEKEKDVACLEKLLSSQANLEKEVIKDLELINKTYIYPRKTVISSDEEKIEEVDTTALIAKEDTMVVLTRDGYLKRTNMRSYQSSLSGDALKDFPKLKNGDVMVMNIKCSTHDGILAFLASGNYIYIPVYSIPEAKWKDEGKHISLLVNNLSPSDKIVSAYIIDEFNIPTYVVICTKKSKIKRIELKNFENHKLTTRALKCFNMQEGDEVVSACLTNRNSTLICLNTFGEISSYNESEVPVVGLKAGGVKAMNTNVDISKMIVLDNFETYYLGVIGDKASFILFTSDVIDTTPGRLGRKTQLVKMLKSSPLKTVDIIPIKRAEKSSSLSLVSQDSTCLIDLKEIRAVNVPAQTMRVNKIEALSDQIVVGAHQEGKIIDSNFKLDKEVEVKTSSVKKDDSIEQLSLFDMFNNED